MSEENYQPTKAEFLAGLITGDAGMQGITGTIQRSHRFPINIYSQIENLARISNMPVSLIINELLECGLEAVKKELPEDIVSKMTLLREEHLKPNFKYITVDTDTERKNKTKLKSSK